MIRRAERMLSGLEETRRADKVANLRFPDPAPCGKVPLTAEGLSKSYGSLEVFTDVDLAVDRGSKVVVLGDRKSTRLNSSHVAISYAVFCLKKKNNTQEQEKMH